ncbi:MAG: IS3 family transposase [Chlorobiales bacterium]|nr:IS3 family transposase [Chlorobiales bacterium]
MARFIEWLDIAPSKYYNWQSRYGKVNEHNALIPRDFWLEEWEKQAIVNFHAQYPLEGYRRLTYMMLDQNIVAVSPSSVYRVLSTAGLLRRWNTKKGSKGKGFVQPLKPHEHWHIDVSYVNLLGTFYYLCSTLDGCSRYIVHWELRKAMTEKDVEIILQRAREKFPGAKPRIISDNGPQFIAKDFKEYIRLTGMSHVRTSPFYPQSNGKLERYHKTIKAECIRPKVALSLEDARNQIDGYIRFYNNERLHSAIGYIAPKDKLEGQDTQIFKERGQKLEAAREARKQKRLEYRERLNSNNVSATTDNFNQLTQQRQFSISS